MKVHQKILCLITTIFIFLSHNVAHSQESSSQSQQEVLRNDKKLEKINMLVDNFLPKGEPYSLINIDYSGRLSENWKVSNLADASFAVNVINIFDFLKLGIHAGVRDFQNDIPFSEINVPFTNNFDIYGGIHASLDTNLIYFSADLSKHNNVTWNQKFGNPMDAFFKTLNFVADPSELDFTASAGLNFLNSRNNFFGPIGGFIGSKSKSGSFDVTEFGLLFSKLIYNDLNSVFYARTYGLLEIDDVFKSSKWDINSAVTNLGKKVQEPKGNSFKAGLDFVVSGNNYEIKLGLYARKSDLSSLSMPENYGLLFDIDISIL